MLLSSPNSLALMENVSVDVRKNIISWINPSNFLPLFFCRDWIQSEGINPVHDSRIKANVWRIVKARIFN